MIQVTARCLAASGSSSENEMMSRVFRAAADLVNRYCNMMHVPDDPFAYNETASVSVICSAANVAGYVALAEYGGQKRRGRGRIDLYISSPAEDWIIEAKQWIPYDAPDGRLVSRASAALSDAEDSAIGGEIPLGLVIVSFAELNDESAAERTVLNVENAALKSRHAWLIESRQNPFLRTAFLFQGCALA